MHPTVSLLWSYLRCSLKILQTLAHVSVDVSIEA